MSGKYNKCRISQNKISSVKEHILNRACINFASVLRIFMITIQRNYSALSIIHQFDTKRNRLVFIVQCSLQWGNAQSSEVSNDFYINKASSFKGKVRRAIKFSSYQWVTYFYTYVTYSKMIIEYLKKAVTIMQVCCAKILNGVFKILIFF